jgi:hypothetical protein
VGDMERKSMVVEEIFLAFDSLTIEVNKIYSSMKRVITKRDPAKHQFTIK